MQYFPATEAGFAQLFMGQHVNFHDIVMNDCGYRIGHHVTFNFGSATGLYTQFTQCSECAGPT